MATYRNTRMLDLLESTPSPSPSLNAEDRELLAGPIVERHGCLVLAEIYEANPHLRLEGWPFDGDAVQYEASVNDVGLGFEEDRAGLASLAVEGVEVLVENLRRRGIPGPVRVIATVDALSEIPSVTVRFHRIRDGVRSWIEVEDLEEYETGGVLIVDIDS